MLRSRRQPAIDAGLASPLNYWAVAQPARAVSPMTMAPRRALQMNAVSADCSCAAVLQRRGVFSNYVAHRGSNQYL